MNRRPNEDYDIKKILSLNLETLLSEEPHILEIKYDKKWEFPEIDYSRFKEEFVEKVKKSIDRILCGFMNTPYIIDDFPNSEKRNLWRSRDKKKKEIIDFMQMNCLRTGNIAALYAGLSIINSSYIGENKIKINKLYKNILSTREEIYNNENQNRVPLVKELKQKVYDLMVFLSK